MKALTVLIAAMLCACHCYGQSNVVYYGVNSNAISLAFVDTNLSESAKSAITADLRMCLSEWGKTSEFDLGPYEPGVIGYLYNPDKSPHYPENIRFPRKLVTNGASDLALQIPKTLSDAYTNAFAFAAANSNIVAAAYEFVAFVSSSNFVALSSNALPDYVMQKNMSTNDIVETADEIFSDLQKQTYYPPSILGFYYSQRGPSVSNLWLHVPSSINPPLGMDWLPFPALWHEGKWRFCVWDNWVQ